MGRRQSSSHRHMAVAMASILAVGAEPLEKGSRPNIMLLTADQQRLDTMGCYGSTFAKSPNIDRLAREGVLFKESYTASPVCEGARASWVTGVQLPVHNVWGNGITSHRMWPMSDIIRPLKKAGYYTAVIGKTHYDPLPPYDFTDVHSANLDRREPRTPAAEYLETYLVNKTMEFLEHRRQPGNASQPWYVHLSFISPHPPSNVPLEWHGVGQSMKLPKLRYGGPSEVAGFPGQMQGIAGVYGEGNARAFPDGQPNTTWIDSLRIQYYELANYVDFQVGRMLEYLDSSGLADNTLIIYSADHGTNLYDHGIGGKYNFFDESWRVPLIMRGPGIPKGETRSFAAGVDVPASILAAAKAPRTPGINGMDLVGALKDGVKIWPRSNGAAAALLQGLAVVTTKWKLSFYLDDGKGQLFDRVKDPEELSNLFDDVSHAAIKSRLLTALLRWRAGLEPVAWMQEHMVPGSPMADVKYVRGYTMNLTGLEPEMQLQLDLAHPELQVGSGLAVRLWFGSSLV